MNSVAERVTDVRNPSERRPICSHCGWHEIASDRKTDEAPGHYIAGGANSTDKYRIIM